MNEFQRLICLLKVAYQNFWTLHHNLTGDPAWKGNHEWIANWYGECESEADHIIELGLQMGIREPSINDALLAFPAIPTDDRGLEDTQKIAIDTMTQLMSELTAAQTGQPGDVINQLQGYQDYWRTELYKLGHATGMPKPKMLDEDE